MAFEGEPVTEKPKYRIMFTRHAERLPTGELSEEGRKHADRKGELLRGSAEVLKGYASDHPSKRAVDTANLISESTGIRSALTEKPYETREIRDFQYDVFAPDLTKHLKIAKDMINEVTLRDGGLSTERNENGELKIDIEKPIAGMAVEEQERIAAIRQNNQKIGLDYLLSQPEVVERLASRMAERLVHEMQVMSRAQRSRKEKPLERDMVLNNVGHGVFTEALFQKAAVYVDDQKNKHEGVSLNREEFGGYLEPLESFSIDLDDPSNLPDLIPVTFERPDRPHGKVFLKLDALKELAAVYNERKKIIRERKNS